jgi:hypothetical protein
MRTLRLEGTYRDELGCEDVIWVVASSSRAGWQDRYEITATIRSAEVSGVDFDALEPAARSEALSLNSAGELDDCILTLRVPVTVHPAGTSYLELAMELRHGAAAPRTTATLVINNERVTHTQAEILEVVLGALIEPAKPRRWECCLTCGLSDYSPAGQGLMGMRCHRDSRDQYLAVTSKADYWDVPVTELVPEFYRCEVYEPRSPGTGYRG